MIRKSYFGNTVEAAMALARREMGEEVWLVAARPATETERHWGGYAIEVASEPSVKPQVEAPETRTHGAMSAELAGLRKELTQLGQALAATQGMTAPAHLLPAVWARLHIRLRAAGVPAEVALEWIVQAEMRGGATADVSAASAALRAIIEEQMVVRPVASSSSGPRRIALVGPPGAGKTTLLVKLAWRLGLEARRQVALVSIDTQRIAAADQLRCYASIIGVPCRVAETPWALRQALVDCSGSDLVLIDTPGFGAREADALNLAAGFWPAEMEPEVHLVLTVQAGSADLWSAVERFQPFRPAALAFTRLDETSTAGAMAAVAVRSRLPVSYLSFGQCIPEDFEPATSARLCDWLFGEVRLQGSDTAANGAAA